MAAKKVTCDCGKTMREPDDEKLIATVQKHAQDVHNMTLTKEQVLAMGSRRRWQPIRPSLRRWLGGLAGGSTCDSSGASCPSPADRM